MYILILAKIPIIVYFSSLMLILPIIVGSINIKELKGTPLIILLAYCLVFGCMEITSWYYALHGWQNHFVDNLVNYIDIFFIQYFYFCILNNPIHKKIIIAISVIALLVILYSNFGDFRDFNRIDSFAKSFVDMVIIFTSLLFFYQLLNNLEVKNLFQYSYFWITTSILIYFSGVFFVNIFAEYITFNKDESITHYWVLKEYLTIFHRILLAIGLWFSTTPIQSNLSSK